jgi:ribonuclease M5
MMRVKEVIVVEGRSDERAVKRAVDAQVIITSGYGIRESTFLAIEEAAKRCGVIIFTDPDFMGERIRERLKLRVPAAKHAYLSRADATSEGDIGIENAKPEAILAALEKVRTWVETPVDTFTKSDLIRNGLEGGPGALDRRDRRKMEDPKHAETDVAVHHTVYHGQIRVPFFQKPGPEFPDR